MSLELEEFQLKLPKRVLTMLTFVNVDNIQLQITRLSLFVVVHYFNNETGSAREPQCVIHT